MTARQAHERDDVLDHSGTEHGRTAPPPAAGPVDDVALNDFGIRDHPVGPDLLPGLRQERIQAHGRRTLPLSHRHRPGASYAAGMVAIPDSARPVLEGPNLAHVVTIDPDGAPQVSCVWVGLDGDEVVFASLGPWRKLRNLERDARIALSVESPELNDMGMREYLVLQGTARVVSGGAPEMLQDLAHVYLGPEVRFPPMDDPPPGSVVRITVDRISGVGPWTG